MICILASSKFEAERWARGQRLTNKEWFFGDENSLVSTGRGTFHVISLESFWNLPATYIERITCLVDQRK